MLKNTLKHNCAKMCGANIKSESKLQKNKYGSMHVWVIFMHELGMWDYYIYKMALELS